MWRPVGLYLHIMTARSRANVPAGAASRQASVADEEQAAHDQERLSLDRISFNNQEVPSGAVARRSSAVAPARRPPWGSAVRWVILAAVVVSLGAVGFLALRASRPTVTVTQIVEGPAVQAFYATGTLEPADREHWLKAAAAGFVQNPDASRPYIDKGDRVRKGQVLAVVYDEMLQQMYDKALADAVEKRARADSATSPVLQELDANISAYGDLVAAAKRTFDRYEKGVAARALSQADFDLSLDRLKDLWSKHESFKAQKLQMKLRLERELAESESALRSATWNLEKMKVVSPIDGFVLDKPQQVGTKVAVNDLIVTVANTSPENLVMRAQVDEEDVTKVWEPRTKERLAAAMPWFGLGRVLDAWVEQPQIVRMTLYAFEGQSFTGHVARIYPKADPERRTFEVDVRMNEPSPRMQHGMTGELAFEVAHKDRTLVAPSQAFQDGKFWIVRDGRLIRTDAQPGLRGVERVEVATGLKPGDRVVVSPIAGLSDGQAVKIGQELDPRAAADLNKPKKKELFRGGF